MHWKLIYTWDESAQVGKAPPSFVELYDRQRDPDEAHNLATEPKLQIVRQRLAQAIEQHLAELKRNGS